MEKALTKQELIPKDVLYCSPEALKVFMQQFEDKEKLNKVFEDSLRIKEEIWFEIFRSIHPNSEDLDDEEAIKQHAH